MLRTAAAKIAWVGRTASMVFGLALVMALVLGVATIALAAVPGDPFKLGRINSINAMTQLVGSRDGAMVRVENNSAGGNAHALALEVNGGKAPLRVNANAGKATNLNADKLDGFSSDALLPGGPLPRGSTVRGSYVVRFDPAAAGFNASESIPFGYTLASAPNSHFVAIGTTPPPGCTGTGSNPQAAPGFFCVYETANFDTASTAICHPISIQCFDSSGAPDSASRYGGYLRTTATSGNANSRTIGTWAVTGS